MSVRAMMDVDDLLASGRLHVMASQLGADIGNTFIALSFVYSTTQDAGEHQVTQMMLARLVRARFLTCCPMVNVEKMLPAMVEAQLAEVVEDGLWEIVGNKKRIEELGRYHDAKVTAGRRGGLQKAENAKKPNDFLKQNLAKPSAVAVAVAVANSKKGSVCNADSDPPRAAAAGTHTPNVQNLEKAWLELQASDRERLSDAERITLAQIAASAKKPLEVLQRFRADERDAYESRGWPLEMCLKDIDQHTRAPRQAKGKAAAAEAKRKYDEDLAKFAAEG